MSSLKEILGGMASIPQFFLWRIEWDAEEGKYQKNPATLDGLHWPVSAGAATCEHGQVWATYDEAVSRLRDGYALGFYLTKECGYWFLDLDKCYDALGAVMPEALELVNRFPGAAVELSSSGKGLHVFGRGAVPPDHRMKPPKHLRSKLPFEIEFYNDLRGVCFGLHLVGQGSADTVHDAAVAALVEQYFPPRTVADTDARGDWRGPADDDELIRRMLNAQQSAAVTMGGKVGLPQLWRGEAEKNNENDMSLANHLAFWTGCDIERMERLARRSGMYRAKWDTRRRHTTYIGITCENAAAGCQNVYQEAQRDVMAMYAHTPAPLLSVERVSPELLNKIDALLTIIAESGTLADVHNVAIPACQEARIPPALAEQLAQAINKRLDLFGAKLPIAKVRSLINPPMLAQVNGEPPLWMQRHCFVLEGDYFYNVETGEELTRVGFEAAYSRQMPLKENGKRENPVEWAFNKWDVMTVNRKGYRPTEGPYFDWAGFRYANEFVPSSLPALEPYTEEGIAAIEEFKRHLWLITGQREDVYMAMLHWIAYNVQKPGRKIRWSPLVKGVPGDGKSIIADVIRAGLGARNVKMTNISNVTNNGGFTDWAVGAAVNCIEEIRLVGAIRYAIFNVMKTYISDDYIDINAKGGKAYGLVNVTNHIAFSNYNDALPVDDDDRRWLIVFTPWPDITAAAAAHGTTVEGQVELFQRIGASCKREPGQWRQWLLSVDTSSFNPDGRAPHTNERGMMISSSADPIDDVIREILEEGAVGVSKLAFSSTHLRNALKLREISNPNLEIPKSVHWNHIITRLGYMQLPKPVKWANQTVRIWVKFQNIDWRAELDKHL